MDNFKDKNFSVKYKTIDASRQTKYKESGQQFQLVMEGKPKQNVMKTETINLFDHHIQKANLYGLQAHFHAPSEHTIDGKLMDLEMHVVHQMDPELTNADSNKKSQFSHGVLGFLFKAVPDNYFGRNGVDDYHDQFLNGILDDQQYNSKLDLTKFVHKLKFHKRWTYQGSLTTTPFSEGILWNVVEQVIPIRQSTLDKFLEYRKIEESQIIAPFANSAARAENDELR